MFSCKIAGGTTTAAIWSQSIIQANLLETNQVKTLQLENAPWAPTLAQKMYVDNRNRSGENGRSLRNSRQRTPSI